MVLTWREPANAKAADAAVVEPGEVAASEAVRRTPRPWEGAATPRQWSEAMSEMVSSSLHNLFQGGAGSLPGQSKAVPAEAAVDENADPQSHPEPASMQPPIFVGQERALSEETSPVPTGRACHRPQAPPQDLSGQTSRSEAQNPPVPTGDQPKRAAPRRSASSGAEPKKQVPPCPYP